MYFYEGVPFGEDVLKFIFFFDKFFFDDFHGIDLCSFEFSNEIYFAIAAASDDTE